MVLMSQMAAGQTDDRTEFSGLTATSILASAVVPGAGQAMERRWITSAVFAAIEVTAWWIALDRRGEGNRLRTAYRDLAWEVARNRSAPRVDGSFEYYERLIHWTRSGSFDASAEAGLQPERAPDAFNGRQWRLAAEIFLGGDISAPPTAPGYAAAIDYYRGRAYQEPFVWDWTGRAPDQERFAALIDESDGALRRSSVAVGAAIANHVLSAAEAYVNQRLGRRAVELAMTPGDLRGPAGASLLLRILP
jgi:hypothetical protein